MAPRGFIGYQNLHPPRTINLPLVSTLSLRLLLDVVLSTALLRLSLGAHLIIADLFGTITREARDGAPKSTLRPVRGTGTKVSELTLGFLPLTFEVLLTAGLLQGLAVALATNSLLRVHSHGGTYLAACQVSDGLLSGADGLVPGTLGAVRVVTDGGAGARDGATRHLGRGVRSVVLRPGTLLTELTLGLVASVAGEVAESLLGLAGGRVDVGLESGGLVLGHDDGWDVNEEWKS